MGGGRTPGKIEPELATKLPKWAAINCSMGGDDCSNTMCCRDPGMQCYQKMEGWAVCRASCNPGPDPMDIDSAAWTCRELGPRAPGIADIVPIWTMKPANWVSMKCSKGGEDCSKTR